MGKNSPKECQSDQNKYENHWPLILPVVKSIINNQPVSIEEWQNVFHHVHLICLWDPKGLIKLITALQAELTDGFIARVKSRLRGIEDGHQQLKEYVDAWQEYCEHHCKRIPIAFQQLDLAIKNMAVKRRVEERPTTHVKQIDGSAVRAIVLRIWNQEILEPLEERLHSRAMELIMEDRHGLLVDSRLVVELRKSFNILSRLTIDPSNKYIKSFEARYVDALWMFYKSRADDYYAQHGLIAYINWALTNIENENRRARTYLDNESQIIERINQTCSRILVSNFAHHAALECGDYINRSELKNMQMIYKFLKRSSCDCVMLFLEEFRGFVVVNCLSHLISPEWLVASNCEKFTELVMELFNRFKSIVIFCLDGDPRAKNALERAFISVINDERIFTTHETTLNNTTQTTLTSPTQNPSAKSFSCPPDSRCAELLANYCDMLLRRTTISKKLTSSEISVRLDNIISIIRFLKNKEAFLKFHKQHLMRRLMLETSSDHAKEQEFVLSLREVQHIPLEKITHLIRMFKDLKTSEDLYRKFRLSLQEDGNISNNNNEVLTSAILHSNCENIINSTSATSQESKYITFRKQTECLSVKVLNPSAWIKVTNQGNSINLPNEISAIIPEYEQFYRQQHEGRRLIWSPQLSNGVISFSSKKGKYDLEVLAPQLAILSAFNDQSIKGLMIKDLVRLTGLNPVELRRNIRVS